jgi:choline-sulfatase
VRLPEKIGGAKPAKIDADVQLTDLVPTLLDLAALPAEATDGFSLKPALTGAGQVQPRPIVMAQYYATGAWVTPIRMVRHRDWKLTFYLGHGQELYHLAQDPHELENHAYDPVYGNITRQLLGILQQMLQRTGDPFTQLKPTKMNGEPIEQ